MEISFHWSEISLTASKNDWNRLNQISAVSVFLIYIINTKMAFFPRTILIDFGSFPICYSIRNVVSNNEMYRSAQFQTNVDMYFDIIFSIVDRKIWFSDPFAHIIFSTFNFGIGKLNGSTCHNGSSSSTKNRKKE